MELASTETLSAHESFQRYRLNVIATWPESEWKRVALAAADAALQEELAFERVAPRMGGASADLLGRVHKTRR